MSCVSLCFDRGNDVASGDAALQREAFVCVPEAWSGGVLAAKTLNFKT